jgi:RNA polymerase sigma factor (sigma-70 family)
MTENGLQQGRSPHHVGCGGAMNEPTNDASTSPPSPEVAAVLVENHRAFLRFLEKHVGDRALAEDILQDAFVRSAAKADGLRDHEALVPWFYRVLRNAVTDHARRSATAKRALEAFATELENEADESDVQRSVCQCVTALASTLKPEYAAALKRIEIDGLAVKDFAHESGITSSNAAVRVFRAREALRKQVQRSCGTCATHGCVDCTCATAP